MGGFLTQHIKFLSEAGVKLNAERGEKKVIGGKYYGRCQQKMQNLVEISQGGGNNFLWSKSMRMCEREKRYFRGRREK